MEFLNSRSTIVDLPQEILWSIFDKIELEQVLSIQRTNRIVQQAIQHPWVLNTRITQLKQEIIVFFKDNYSKDVEQELKDFVSENSIRTIRNFVDYKSLRSFLYDNKINRKIKPLAVLSVNFKCIDEIPIGIDQLSSLKELYFNNNKIQEMSSRLRVNAPKGARAPLASFKRKQSSPARCGTRSPTGSSSLRERGRSSSEPRHSLRS